MVFCMGILVNVNFDSLTFTHYKIVKVAISTVKGATSVKDLAELE